MAQTPKYQVPAHPSGLDMRTQINGIVLSMIGDNSGPTQPAELYPGMMWGDTTAMRLKRRNNANTAWVDIGPIDAFTSEANAAAANKVNKTGDTMSGSLSMYAAGVISSPIYFNANGYNPHIRTNNQGWGFEWVNTANTSVVATLSDAGLFSASGVTLKNQSELTMQHTKGNMRLRGDGGIGSYGGIGFINGAGSAWRWQLTDEGYWTVFNYCLSTINVCPANLDANGFQGTLGPGFIKINEYNYGAYLDFARARSEDYQWRIHYNFSGNSLEFINRTGGGSLTMTSNGDLYTAATGQWLSTINSNVNAKSNKNTQIVWASGIRELGALAPGGGDVVADAGNPWAMEGIRCTGGGATWIWPRAIWYATP